MNLTILYKIGLYFNLKRSIALIGMCREMWSKREQFYKDKQLLQNRGKKVIDLWTPEQNYYLGDKQLILGATSYTLHIEISELYIYNNITYKLLDYDNRYIFRPEHMYMLVYDSPQMEVKYFDTMEEVIQCLKSLENYVFVEYTIINLQKSTICWTKWHNEPRVDEQSGVLSKNSKGIVKNELY